MVRSRSRPSPRGPLPISGETRAATPSKCVQQGPEFRALAILWIAMPSRQAVRPLSGSPTARWLCVGVIIAMFVSGCTVGAHSSSASNGTAHGLSSAVSGVCEAAAALPDRATAERVFTNVAHEPLHGLAADSRLDRALSADILEAMQVVEEDFGGTADAGRLSGDLGALRTAAATALGAIGEIVPGCVE